MKVKTLPLNKFHKSLNAQFGSLGSWQIPYSYSDPAAEYSTLLNSVALIDRSYHGKIRLRGKDTLDLLNRISTNDLTGLMLGNACDTVFTTPKGRIIDYCRILNLDEEILIVSSHHDVTHLMEWINRFIILEDVEIEDVSSEYLWLMICGPQSIILLENIDHTSEIGIDDQIWVKLGGETIPVFCERDFIVPSFDICLPARNSEMIVGEFYHFLQKAAGQMAGQIAYQSLRVESGIPQWGSELCETYNPHEARLVNAISFTKGCYTGQEVIARLDTYDKVQKYLMVINPDGEIGNNLPMDIYLDDEKIGVLTSFTKNPQSNKIIGLGYIGKHYAVEDFQIHAEIIDGDIRVPSTLRIPPKNLT